MLVVCVSIIRVHHWLQFQGKASVASRSSTDTDKMEEGPSELPEETWSKQVGLWAHVALVGITLQVVKHDASLGCCYTCTSMGVNLFVFRLPSLIICVEVKGHFYQPNIILFWPAVSQRAGVIFQCVHVDSFVNVHVWCLCVLVGDSSCSVVASSTCSLYSWLAVYRRTRTVALTRSVTHLYIAP